MPRHRSRFEIAGPHGPRRVHRDAWGTPRVRVRDHDEAAWTLGYLHATDRLLQVRLQLMAARGRTMEFLGDRPLTRAIDRAVRSVGLASDLHLQVARLDPATRARATRYCQGFDAGARANTGGRRRLARALGLGDAPYTLHDMVALYRLTTWFGLNSLTQSNALVVAMLASSLKASGRSLDDLRALWGDTLGEIDLDAAAECRWPEALRALLVDLPAGPGGSNAFAVAGAHSASGKPILVAEFHLEVGQLPPLLYAMHIDLGDETEPGDDFVHGVSIPGLPTAAAGRNRDVAWTYTFGHAANIELWYERCAQGSRMGPRGPVPLRRRVEPVKVRQGVGDARTERWTFWDGDHGTVLGDAADGGTFPALRWRGLDRTHEDLDALLKVTAARSVAELVELHGQVRAAALAGVFADRHGHIARVHTGEVGPAAVHWGPRPGWLETDAEQRPALRPVLLDPDAGFVVSANEHLPGWTAFAEPPYRHARLSAELAARCRPGAPALTGGALLTLSYDEHDALAAAVAERWAPLLASVAPPEALATTDPHALHRAVLHELVADRLGPDHAAWLMRDPAVTLGLHRHIDPQLFDEPDPDWLTPLLHRAWQRLSSRPPVPGEDTPALGHLRFRHLLEGELAFPTPLSGRRVRLPGGPVSPFQIRVSRVRGHRIVTGPAFHLVMDLGERSSRYNLAGGASELPGLPGYGAGVGAWVRAETLPLG